MGHTWCKHKRRALHWQVHEHWRLAPRRAILDRQLCSGLRCVLGSSGELQLLPALLPIQYRMRKLCNLLYLDICRNIFFPLDLNPILIEDYCLDFGSSGIISGFFRTEIMMLRRDVCMNASTIVLCFDAKFIIDDKCSVVEIGNDWLWMTTAVNNKQRQIVCALRRVVVTNSRTYGKLVK